MSGRTESADNASSDDGIAQPDDQPPRGMQGVFACAEGQLREIRNERPPARIFRVSPEFLEIKPAVVADHIDASAAVAAFEALHVRQMITFRAFPMSPRPRTLSVRCLCRGPLLEGVRLFSGLCRFALSAGQLQEGGERARYESVAPFDE